ncbi:ShlB/FhaC/HecB family hemolysin secretion/activation protein [Hyphococcus sp. DH-69]|uniref:ShlB/FhaC/HecB family hemolysin secretion/activation protein n=1 Tax=Hyphococcus formosus TaxID=3143534 RepID=UPI00398B562D
MKKLQSHILLFALLIGSAIAAQTPLTEERLRPGEIRDTEVPEAVNEPSSNVTVSIEPKDLPPILIRGIKFEGTSVPANVADAARPFIARTITKDALNELAAALTAAYEQSPIALFTIVIPDQAFENGVVRVLVAEGHIENFSFSGETENRNHYLITAYAERLTAETPLSRATLERSLSLMSDIPGVAVKPTLSYGSAPGAVRLDLALDYKKPTVSFGFNNRTSRLIRDGQFTAQAKAYRLLRDGDVTSLNLAAAANFKDSRYAGISHSTPIGANGVRLDASAAILQSRPKDSVISGDAQLYSGGVTVPVIRSYKRNLSVRASLDAVNSDNAAFGSLIATERTRAARLAATLSLLSKKRIAKLSATASQGIDMMGAEVSPIIGDKTYTKLSGDIYVLQKIGSEGRLTFTGGGQWTDDNLPANERFSIGGARYGRAFSAGLINADRGFGLLLEPAWRPFNGDFGKSELYAFIDYAHADVFARSATADQSYDLGSVGGGIRAAYKDKGFIELELAHPYDQPVPGFDQDWRFSVNWRLDIRP